MVTVARGVVNYWRVEVGYLIGGHGTSMRPVSRHRKSFIRVHPFGRLDTDLYTQTGRHPARGLRCLDTHAMILL
jgi:hypothetical protein